MPAKRLFITFLALNLGLALHALDKKPKQHQRSSENDSPMASLWNPYKDGNERDIRLKYELPSKVWDIAHDLFAAGTVDREVAENGTRQGRRIHPLITKWFRIHANYSKILTGGVDKLSLYAALKSTIEQRIRCFEEIEILKRSHNFETEEMGDIITTWAIGQEIIEKDRLRLPILEAWGRTLKI